MIHRAIEIYPFAESVWTPSRGLELKLAAGLQSRFHLVHTEHFIWLMGLGFFGEYEQWNYNGVPLPHTFEGNKYQRSIKSQLHTGFKFQLTEKWLFIASAYMHNRLDSNIVNPRWALALDLRGLVLLPISLPYQAHSPNSKRIYRFHRRGICVVLKKMLLKFFTRKILCIFAV